MNLITRMRCFIKITTLSILRLIAYRLYRERLSANQLFNSQPEPAGKYEYKEVPSDLKITEICL